MNWRTSPARLGCIPGKEKQRLHLKFPETAAFNDLLLDIYGAVRYGVGKPLLHIMDAVLAMEGNGPGSKGTPRRMNLLLASEDALALDYTAIQCTDLDFNRALHIKNGFDGRFGLNSPQDIDIVGERPEDVRINNYKRPKTSAMENAAWLLNSTFIKNLLTDRPVPQSAACTLCYQCQKVCPAEAIHKDDKGRGVPSIDYAACIRCYCCMEICPEGAMDKQQGLLGRVIFR